MKRKTITMGLWVCMSAFSIGYAAEKMDTVSVAEKAFQLRLAGKSVQAKEMLAGHLKEHPDDTLAQFEYSRTVGYLMDFELAEKHAILAAQQSPGNARFHYWKGICGTYLFIDKAHHQNNLDPAILGRSIAAFEKAVELKPDYHKARFLLVNLLNNNPPEHGGNQKAAHKQADRLMEMDLDYGLQALMVIEGGKPVDWKIKQYQAALVKEPDNAGLHAEIAKLYIQSGQMEAMQKHLDKALELDSRKKDVLLDVVFQLAMKKDYESAKKMVQRYLKLTADDPAAMRAFGTFYLAQVEKMSGDPKADTTLKQVRQIDPNVWMTMKAPPAMLFEPLQ